MKRFHLHMRVLDMESNVEFYSSLFGSPPKLLEPNRAQWVLDDLPLTFTVTNRGRTPGLEHLGIHVDTLEELASVQMHFARLDGGREHEPQASPKETAGDIHLLMDPQGVLWEATRVAADGLPPRIRTPRRELG